MLRSDASHRDIIGSHAGAIESREEPVDQYKGCASTLQLNERARVVLRSSRRDDQPFHPAAQEHLDRSRFTLRIAMCVAEHQVVTCGLQSVLETPCDLGEEAMRDVRNDNTDHPGLPCHQAARPSIRTIMQRSA